MENSGSAYFVSVGRQKSFQWVSDKREFVECLHVLQLLF